MNLDELRAFIAVAETGSFTAAAKSLNFAREALAAQVDDLEARTGVQLLRRAADAASVTRAGEMLAKKARVLMTETRAILDAVRSLEQQSDLLTIEVPHGLPPTIEETALTTFRKVAPSVRWRVRYTDGRYNPESDATFALHFGSEPAQDARFKTSRIAKVRVGLFASETYLKARGTPTNVADLSNHDLLVWDRYDRDPHVLPLLASGGTPALIEPALVSPSPYLLRQFALNGHGITLSPSSKIAGFLDGSVPLIPILRDTVGDEVEAWMSTRASAESGAIGVLASAIARFVGAALKSMDG